MSAEPVALIPQCGECGRVWLPADQDRWRCLLVDNDDESGGDELAFFCPDCAKREFGYYDR